MTNEQIKKALERCNSDACEHCPYYYDAKCRDILIDAALDLITKQEKEIERLKAKLEDKIENGTLVPKYSIVDCGNTYCVCTVDTDNLLIIDEYETKAEAEKRLEEIRK